MTETEGTQGPTEGIWHCEMDVSFRGPKRRRLHFRPHMPPQSRGAGGSGPSAAVLRGGAGAATGPEGPDLTVGFSLDGLPV